MKRFSVLALLALRSLSFGGELVDSVMAASKRCDDEIAKIIAVPSAERTFGNTAMAYDDAITRFENQTAFALFLQNVSTEATIRDDSRQAEQFLANYEVDLGKRVDLYKAFKELADKKLPLDADQQLFLDHTMRDYRRAGMALSEDKRKRLAEIDKELNKLSQDFETNIAEDESRLPLTLAELRGVPKDALSKLPRNGDVYLVGFDYPTYDAIVTYCTVDATRQKVQWINRRRGGMRNVELLEKVLPLRAEEAKILGFSNTVDYIVEPKMAKNAETIAKFYDGLRPLVKAKAKQDIEELKSAKREMTKNKNAVLNPWDVAIVNNYLLNKKYHVDPLKVAEYFPVERVVQGLFDVVQELYNVKMTDVSANMSQLGIPRWHADEKLYEFKDLGTGQVLGHMIMDLYPRDHKYSHAACWGLHHIKSFQDGSKELPLAALVCNLTKPTSDKPALLQHDEVITLFHEFGHGLHNIFSKARIGQLSGASVAQDFVEAPSQMMENWVWQPEILKRFAKHYKTGQTIPDDMVKNMVAARQLGSGINTELQLWLGDMDQQFHLAKDGKVDTTRVHNELYDKDTEFAHLPDTFYHASFGHLMGYGASYYSYLWSLVFAQDMFERFKEMGSLNPKAGAYYRDNILAPGGTIEADKLVRNYLGREPSMDPFLKHLGLKK